MADKSDTLKDAYRYVLALVTADASEALRIAGEYSDEGVKDLFASVSGVAIGIFRSVGPVLREKLEASLRFGVTGDESYLDAAAKADEPPPGQYL